MQRPRMVKLRPRMPRRPTEPRRPTTPRLPPSNRHPPRLLRPQIRAVMAGHPSPFAPASFPELPQVAGGRLATAAAGIRHKGRTDLLLVRFDPVAAVAGVFTKSRCASAPVEWCRAILAGGEARALVVNSGNANAFTGMKGRTAAEASAKAAAAAVGCALEQVF